MLKFGEDMRLSQPIAVSENLGPPLRAKERQPYSRRRRKVVTHAIPIPALINKTQIGPETDYIVLVMVDGRGMDLHATDFVSDHPRQEWKDV